MEEKVQCTNWNPPFPLALRLENFAQHDQRVQTVQTYENSCQISVEFGHSQREWPNSTVGEN
jgi:hypothetical protein